MVPPVTANRLTLVIPTYGRPDRAARALRFWAGRGFRVLMLDGSDTPIAPPAAAAADPGITYLHMPVPLSQRLGHAAERVRTDFVSLCGDDDFLLPSALEASMRFLDAAPGHAACGGQALGFDRGPFGGVRAFLRYPRFHDLDVAQDTPRARAIAHFGRYSPAAVYAVCRTEPWGLAMRALADREFPVYAMGELQFEFLLASAGGIRRLPVLHWLRSHESAARAHAQAKGGDASLSRRLQAPQVWSDPAHAALRAEITAHTARHAAALTGFPEPQAAADFEAAMQAYLHDRASGKGRGLRHGFARLRLPLGLRLRQLRARGVACDTSDVAAVRAALAQG